MKARDTAQALAGRTVRRAGVLTSRWRAAPTVVVVGTQRGGTTSLFRMLRQHPGFFGPLHRKGVHYFDAEFDRGPDWYLGHFPLRAAVERRSRRLGYPAAVGEASPYYMAHPLAPERIRALLPDVAVVVLLRDPIERAYSAYTHERARGFEDRPFDVALREEPAMVEAETARILRDPAYAGERLQHRSYLTRGEYVTQLRRLEEVFGRDRMLVLDSHRLFAEPEREFLPLLDFIGLPPVPELHFDHHNARPRTPLEPELESLLTHHFEPWDRELAEWLGWTPSWLDRDPT